MAIDLKDIVTISGSGGLFKIVKLTPHGILVESLDKQRTKAVKNVQRSKVSTLEDIGIYTTGEEGTIPLSTILWRLYAEFAALVNENLYDTPEKLRTLMKSISPEYDPSRVHEFNLRKILQWYNILVKYTPELFEAVDQNKS